MPDSQIKFAIVFVLYYSYDDFEQLLSDQGPLPDNVRLIVVDNTPHSRCDRERLAYWTKQFGVVSVIAEPENLGYFGAADFALSIYPDLYNFDYVAISNTDVQFQVLEIYRFLNHSQREYENVGAIGPRLTKSDRSRKAQKHYFARPTRRKYESLVRLTSHYYLAAAHRLGSDFKRSLVRARAQDDYQREIYAPHGAFMILSHAYLSLTRGFHNPNFLFNEEIFVGAECEKAELSCVYEPRITYSHRGHGSMGTFPSRRLISYLHDAHKAVLPILQ